MTFGPPLCVGFFSFPKSPQGGSREFCSVSLSLTKTLIEESTHLYLLSCLRTQFLT